MARLDIQQDEVIERIVARLLAYLELGTRQVFETLEPLAPPTIPKGGPYFVTVSPGEGDFIEGEQAPGNITEEWYVTVTAYSRIRLDSTDHDQKLLRDASRGLLILKKKLLAALVGQDITDTGGDTFLRQLLFAKRAERPRHDRDKGIAWISVTFGVHFDWEL